MDDYRVKGLVEPDMAIADFTAELRRLKSPVLGAEAEAVYAYAKARGFSHKALIAWFIHESSAGTKGWAVKTKSWGNTRPPSYARPGIGIYNQDTGEWYPGLLQPIVNGKALPGRFFTAYANWADGGVATVSRFLDNPAYENADTIAKIIPIWAPPKDGNDVAAYVRSVLADIQRLGGDVAKKKIALAAGHHNTSGGDQFEVKQTGPLCAALARACRALGMDVRVVQPDDGMSMTNGSLDLVGNTVVKWHNDGWQPDIFIECHTEGGGGTGIFAIFPDWDSDVDTDVRDTLGPAIARAIAKATGLGMGAGGDGVMSEQQTGVGASGSRLGIFRTTAPLAATCTRLIIEFGAHDKQPDLAIAQKPGFADKCATATAVAVASFLGVTTAPEPGRVDEPARNPHFFPTPATAGFYVVGPFYEVYTARPEADRLVVWGWPRTGEFLDDDPASPFHGYIVQYFDRAVFHRKPADTEAVRVQFGLLGLYAAQARGKA